MGGGCVRNLLLFGAAILVATAPFSTAVGQIGVGSLPEAQDSLFHGWCLSTRLALDTLSHGASRDETLGFFATCEQTGPAFFAQAWGTTGLSTTEQGAIVAASLRLRDERIFLALRAVALDESRDAAIRRTAMSIMAAYAFPQIDGRHALAEGEDGQPTIHLSSATLLVTALGSQPPIAVLPARVDTILGQIASNTGGGGVTSLPRPKAPPGPIHRTSDPVPPALPSDPHTYAAQLRTAIQVLIRPQLHIFGATGTLVATSGAAFVIDLGATDGLGSANGPWQLSVDWGDGTTPYHAGLFALPADVRPLARSHIWIGAVGTQFTVTATVTGKNGTVGTDQFVITIGP
jgi:hypothetical protein